MAGRAGRRGKDPLGSCLINLDPEFYFRGILPEAEEYSSLLQSKGTPLESKFKLTYQMALNVIKSDDIFIHDVLKTSFLESENEKDRNQKLQRAVVLQNLIKNCSKFECICGLESDIKSFFYQY